MTVLSYRNAPTSFASNAFCIGQVDYFQYFISITNIHESELSCRCPLCSQNIGGYLIHSIRSRYDYRKRYLPPLQASPCPLPGNALVLDMRQSTQRRRQDRVWGRGDRWAADESDRLERSISKRRWIYEYKLYAKVSFSIETIGYFIIRINSMLRQTHIPNIGLILRPPNLPPLRI